MDQDGVPGRRAGGSGRKRVTSGGAAMRRKGMRGIVGSGKKENGKTSEADRCTAKRWRPKGRKKKSPSLFFLVVEIEMIMNIN